jgi:hypothetical protein
MVNLGHGPAEPRRYPTEKSEARLCVPKQGFFLVQRRKAYRNDPFHLIAIAGFANMLPKLVFSAFFMVAIGAFFGVAWLVWPNASMIAPEKTGEIGFMGMVVIAKYVGYTIRSVIAVVLAIAAFTVCVFFGVLSAETVSSRRDGSLVYTGNDNTGTSG